MNGFIDLLLQNMSGGRPQTAGREGFGIRKPGRTDVLPPPLPDRISQLGSQKLINLPNAKRPQQELPVIDQTDIETPTEDVDVTATYQQPQTSQSDNILRQTMQSIADLQNKEYTKGKGGFKDILKGLGLGALDAFSKADPRQGLAGMLGAATGGAAGLGIRSAIDSSADDRFIDERKMNKLYQDAAAQGQIADADLNRKYKQTLIDNTIADNAARDTKDKATVEGQRRNSFFHRYKNFDATKATAAQIKELAEFGETPESVGSFDFTKLNVQTIAGQKFLFNANTRSFEDAGLPKDGSKAIVDYTVIDPTTGVESKYSTTSERAAGLKTQLASAGLQIQAAAQRQASSQQFQAGENEKNRAQRQSEFITSFQQKVANEARQFAGDQQKTLQWKANYVRQIQKDLKDGVIDDETATQMLQVVK